MHAEQITTSLAQREKQSKYLQSVQNKYKVKTVVTSE